MEIDKDTVLCFSLSARPSNFGTRFHNFLYARLGLNWLYKGCAVEDIEGAVRGVRALKVRGCAVSMPHKENVMRFLDAIDEGARAIGAVNTIVNDDGRLTGYNTDAMAVEKLIAPLAKDSNTALLGSGGMAKAIAYSLARGGFRNVTIIARNETEGSALAKKHGFNWTPRLEPNDSFSFILNATPIGMAPRTDESPVAKEILSRAEVVLDSVASPSETLLIKTARELGKRVITGFDIVSLQAVEQFRLYTGKVPDEKLVAAAAAHART